MSSTAPPESPPRRQPSRIAAIGALTVLLGTLLTTFGLSFDIQWHVDVGPDTFFTLSHLMLYAGSALAGIASLAMVVDATIKQRRGTTLLRCEGGPAIRVLGSIFSAPLGYLVAGVGAGLFLLYGLVDLWWHSIYGFDAVLNSPPHIALFLSIAVTMVGGIIIFAAARETWWGRIGLMLSASVLMCFAPITTKAFDGLNLPFDAGLVGVIFTCVLTLTLTGVVLRFPGGALGVAATFGLLQIVLWPYSIWAARTYADASGLPLRDGLTNEPPELPSTMPAFLLVAALIIELAMAVRRRRATENVPGFVVAGAVAGSVVAVTMMLQIVLFDPTEYFPPTMYVASTAIGVVFGALGGYLGARIARMLVPDASSPSSMKATSVATDSKRSFA